MKPKTFRLFIKPGCPWCTDALGWLDGHDYSYEVLNVSSDQNARREMLALTGQSKAPSAEIDGHVLADFGAEELEVFLKRNGYEV